MRANIWAFNLKNIMHIGLIRNRQKVDLNYGVFAFLVLQWLLLLCQLY